MKRFIGVLAIAAIAATALFATVASADVARYQSSATLTMTVGNVSSAPADFSIVHKYTINTACDGTFNGTGSWYGGTEKISGTIVNGVVVSSQGTYDGTEFGNPYTWSSNGSTGSDTLGLTFSTTNVLTPTTSFKNHGEYVASVGGGDDAAHSCIGMPIRSSR